MQGSSENTDTVSKLNKRQHKSIQNDVIWCYFVLAHWAFVLTQCIEKDIPFGCCLIGSLPVTQLMWRSLNAVCTCDQSGSKHPDDKVPRSVKAAYKQACPLADRKLGAAEALPCLICQQRSLCSLPSPPHHSSHVWWRARLHAGRLFWFQPVWHICCLSRCVVRLSARLSATGANVLLILLSVFTNRGSRLQTGQHGTHRVEGQEALRDITCTCAAGVTSHQSCSKCAGWRVWVLRIKRCIIC